MARVGFDFRRLHQSSLLLGLGTPVIVAPEFPYVFMKEVYNPGRQTGYMRHHDYSAARQREPHHIQDIARQTLSK